MRPLVITASLLLFFSATLTHAASDLTLTIYPPDTIVRAGFTRD